MRLGLGVAAIVALLAAANVSIAEPAAPGTPAVVTLYGHLFGFPQNNDPNEEARLVNAQFPEGEADLSLALGGSTSFQANGGYGLEYRSTAGLVQVKSREEYGAGGRANLHPEVGFTKPLHLDQAQELTGVHYFSVDDTPVFALGGNDGNDLPDYYPDLDIDYGVRPKASVSMRVWLDGDAAEGGKPTVASGRSAEIDMVSLPETIPGQTFVYRFEVPLGTAKIATIPGQEAPANLRFNVNIAALNSVKAGGMQWGAIAVNSGESFPPSWTLAVKSPLDVELVYPKFVDDKLVVLGIFNSPFGSYDVDLKTVAASWEGPTTPKTLRKPTLDYSVAHGGHFDPVNATWVWDYKADEAKAGQYKVTISAQNRQHTAITSTSAFFTIAKGSEAGKTQAGSSGVQTFRGDVNETLPGGAIPVTPVEPKLVTEDKSKEEGFLPGFSLAAVLVALALLLVRRRQP